MLHYDRATIIEEVPGWLEYGPRGAAVASVLETIARLKAQQVMALQVPSGLEKFWIPIEVVSIPEDHPLYEAARTAPWAATRWIENRAWAVDNKAGGHYYRGCYFVYNLDIGALARCVGHIEDRPIPHQGSVCWPMPEALDRVRAGEADPPCLVCGGIIKSDTISFGQSLVPEVIDRALRSAAECDLLLAIGSTLSVYPVANCVPIAARSGATVVIVNGGPTEMDDVADHVLHAQIADVLPVLVGAAP